MNREVILHVRRRKNLYRRVTVAMAMRSGYKYGEKWRENYVACLGLGLGNQVALGWTTLGTKNSNRLGVPDPKRHSPFYISRRGGKNRAKGLRLGAAI